MYATTREFVSSAHVSTVLCQRNWIRRQRPWQAARRLLELVETRIHEPLLERRDDDQVRGAERGRDDADERERDPDADPPGILILTPL